MDLVVTNMANLLPCQGPRAQAEDTHHRAAAVRPRHRLVPSLHGCIGRTCGRTRTRADSPSGSERRRGRRPSAVTWRGIGYLSERRLSATPSGSSTRGQWPVATNGDSLTHILSSAECATFHLSFDIQGDPSACRLGYVDISYVSG